MVTSFLNRWRRRAHFKAFQQDLKPIFVLSDVSHSQPLQPLIQGEIPPLVLRKVSQRDVAILAWRDRLSAERWVQDNPHTVGAVQIIELRNAGLEHLLGNLHPEARKHYQVELF